MGMFSPHFEREGPGVRKDEPEKRGITLFFQLLMEKFWDIIKVNVIFIIYCIPIITIGAAIGAMTSVTMSMVQKKNVYIFSDFHKAFKENWKQSTICGTISFIIFILLVVAFMFYLRLAKENPVFYAICFMCVFSIIILGFAALYIYPLLTTVSLSIKNILKNSLLLSMVCLKNTLSCTLSYGIVLGISILFYPLSILIFFICTFGVLSFIASFATWGGIKKFIIK